MASSKLSFVVDFDGSGRVIPSGFEDTNKPYKLFIFVIPYPVNMSDENKKAIRLRFKCICIKCIS